MSLSLPGLDPDKITEVAEKGLMVILETDGDEEASEDYDLFSGRDTLSTSLDPLSITKDNYLNSFEAEEQFLLELDSTGKNIIHISFEPDNGWLDVGSSSSGNFEFLAGSSSAYAVSSPYYSGSDGRTTSIPSTLSGSHNPSANAKGSIQYTDVTTKKQVYRNFLVG